LSKQGADLRAVHAPLEIFLTFARVGISGFGGVNFWMRRVLVQEKGWLTDGEYVEGLAMGQLIPGPNVYNLTVILGHRFGGYLGAGLAIAGLLLPPLAVVIALGLVYQRYSELPMVQAALRGMTFVVAGLLLANSVTLARPLPRRPAPWLFLALTFAGIGLLRWPLIPVMAALAPFAIAAVWRESASPEPPEA
jgi:chromate transporter